jgi:hypothetical protein
MVKFLSYLIFFIVLYYVLKTILRYFVRIKTPDTEVKDTKPPEKKSQIDKDKIVDAEYKDL